MQITRTIQPTELFDAIIAQWWTHLEESCELIDTMYGAHLECECRYIADMYADDALCQPCTAAQPAMARDKEITDAMEASAAVIKRAIPALVWRHNLTTSDTYPTWVNERITEYASVW